MERPARGMLAVGMPSCVVGAWVSAFSFFFFFLALLFSDPSALMLLAPALFFHFFWREGLGNSMPLPPRTPKPQICWDVIGGVGVGVFGEVDCTGDCMGL